MQKYPVVFSYGKYPLAGWDNVPLRFQNELRDKLQEEVKQDSSLHLKANTVINKEICVQEEYSTPLCFSIKMQVVLSRIDAAGYEYVVKKYPDEKEYLDKFPHNVMWCFCTLIQKPIQI